MYKYIKQRLKTFSTTAVIQLSEWFGFERYDHETA